MGLLRDTYVYVESNKEAVYSQNRIISEQNKILKQNHEEEMLVKDRVDISKVEYLDLLKKANELENKNKEEHSFYKELQNAIKLPFPLLRAKNISSIVKTRPDILGKDLIVTFTFDDYDLEKEV